MAIDIIDNSRVQLSNGDRKTPLKSIEIQMCLIKKLKYVKRRGNERAQRRFNWRRFSIRTERERGGGGREREEAR